MSVSTADIQSHANYLSKEGISLDDKGMFSTKEKTTLNNWLQKLESLKNIPNQKYYAEAMMKGIDTLSSQKGLKKSIYNVIAGLRSTPGSIREKYTKGEISGDHIALMQLYTRLNNLLSGKPTPNFAIDGILGPDTENKIMGRENVPQQLAQIQAAIDRTFPNLDQNFRKAWANALASRKNPFEYGGKSYTHGIKSDNTYRITADTSKVAKLGEAEAIVKSKQEDTEAKEKQTETEIGKLTTSLTKLQQELSTGFASDDCRMKSSNEGKKFGYPAGKWIRGMDGYYTDDYIKIAQYKKQQIDTAIKSIEKSMAMIGEKKPSNSTLYQSYNAMKDLYIKTITESEGGTMIFNNTKKEGKELDYGLKFAVEKVESMKTPKEMFDYLKQLHQKIHDDTQTPDQVKRYKVLTTQLHNAVYQKLSTDTDKLALVQIITERSSTLRPNGKGGMSAIDNSIDNNMRDYELADRILMDLMMKNGTVESIIKKELGKIDLGEKKPDETLTSLIPTAEPKKAIAEQMLKIMGITTNTTAYKDLSLEQKIVFSGAKKALTMINKASDAELNDPNFTTKIQQELTKIQQEKTNLIQTTIKPIFDAKDTRFGKTSKDFGLTGPGAQAFDLYQDINGSGGILGNKSDQRNTDAQGYITFGVKLTGVIGSAVAATFAAPFTGGGSLLAWASLATTVTAASTTTSLLAFHEYGNTGSENTKDIASQYIVDLPLNMVGFGLINKFAKPMTQGFASAFKNAFGKGGSEALKTLGRQNLKNLGINLAIGSGETVMNVGVDAARQKIVLGKEFNRSALYLQAGMPGILLIASNLITGKHLDPRAFNNHKEFVDNAIKAIDTEMPIIKTKIEELKKSGVPTKEDFKMIQQAEQTLKDIETTRAKLIKDQAELAQYGKNSKTTNNENPTAQKTETGETNTGKPNTTAETQAPAGVKANEGKQLEMQKETAIDTKNIKQGDQIIDSKGKKYTITNPDEGTFRNQQKIQIRDESGTNKIITTEALATDYRKTEALSYDDYAKAAKNMVQELSDLNIAAKNKIKKLDGVNEIIYKRYHNPATEDDIKAMQRALGVVDDGIIGPKTYDALSKQINKAKQQLTDLNTKNTTNSNQGGTQLDLFADKTPAFDITTETVKNLKKGDFVQTMDANTNEIATFEYVGTDTGFYKLKDPSTGKEFFVGQSAFEGQPGHKSFKVGDKEIKASGFKKIESPSTKPDIKTEANVDAQAKQEAEKVELKQAEIEAKDIKAVIEDLSKLDISDNFKRLEKRSNALDKIQSLLNRLPKIPKIKLPNVKKFISDVFNLLKQLWTRKQKEIGNKPNILSNELDQAPKTGKNYKKRLKDMKQEINAAFDKLDNSTKLKEGTAKQFKKMEQQTKPETGTKEDGNNPESPKKKQEQFNEIDESTRPERTEENLKIIREKNLNILNKKESNHIEGELIDRTYRKVKPPSIEGKTNEQIADILIEDPNIICWENRTDRGYGAKRGKIGNTYQEYQGSQNTVMDPRLFEDNLGFGGKKEGESSIFMDKKLNTIGILRSTFDDVGRHGYEYIALDIPYPSVLEHLSQNQEILKEIIRKQFGNKFGEINIPSNQKREKTNLQISKENQQVYIRE